MNLRALLDHSRKVVSGGRLAMDTIPMYALLGRDPMLCQHLHPLELALQAAGVRETFRGAAWSQNCREWVYVDVRLDVEALQRRFTFPLCVVVHENTDERSGLEKGFVCNECHDAVMGLVRGGGLFA